MSLVYEGRAYKLKHKLLIATLHYTTVILFIHDPETNVTVDRPSSAGNFRRVKAEEGNTTKRAREETTHVAIIYGQEASVEITRPSTIDEIQFWKTSEIESEPTWQSFVRPAQAGSDFEKRMKLKASKSRGRQYHKTSQRRNYTRCHHLWSGSLRGNYSSVYHRRDSILENKPTWQSFVCPAQAGSNFEKQVKLKASKSRGRQYHKTSQRRNYTRCHHLWSGSLRGNYSSVYHRRDSILENK
ncbi:hypothetical protein T4D_6135 [Trichinella pseudospiralis]|uniref:Uncharacterized protein n=1 Tax=Trichinella pseudospiralis TaxID=6337 RepID=A0A0V1FIJ1_TRIPS|nr:hypothetical protein T4D_6135 [Trichinella pseudospiralis]